jgi:hypothetical protein
MLCIVLVQECIRRNNKLRLTNASQQLSTEEQGQISWRKPLTEDTGNSQSMAYVQAGLLTEFLRNGTGSDATDQEADQRSSSER